jgi:hypothetical protein
VFGTVILELLPLSIQQGAMLPKMKTLMTGRIVVLK